MTCPKTAIDFIKQREGCRLVAYKDLAGIWTCGYGETGPDIKQGTKFTQKRADEGLQARCDKLAAVIRALVIQQLTDKQLSALVSLVYNIGVGAFRGSTLLKKLNQGDVSGAAAQFLVWNKVKGQVVKGLVLRREAEKALFEAK